MAGQGLGQEDYAAFLERKYGLGAIDQEDLASEGGTASAQVDWQQFHIAACSATSGLFAAPSFALFHNTMPSVALSLLPASGRPLP